MSEELHYDDLNLDQLEQAIKKQIEQDLTILAPIGVEELDRSLPDAWTLPLEEEQVVREDTFSLEIERYAAMSDKELAEAVHNAIMDGEKHPDVKDILAEMAIDTHLLMKEIEAKERDEKQQEHTGKDNYDFGR